MTAIVIDLNQVRETRMTNLTMMVDGVPDLSLPGPDKIRVAVINPLTFLRECIAQSLKLNPKFDVTVFALAADITTPFDIILYHNFNPTPHDVATLNEYGEVIILGNGTDKGGMQQSFEAGAKGYIPADTSSLEYVVNIIGFVQSGGTFVPPSFLKESDRSNEEKKLTDREYKILDCIVQGKQNKVIAYELRLSESTVKVHVRHIMSKLNASNRTQAVAIAKGLFLETK